MKREVHEMKTRVKITAAVFFCVLIGGIIVVPYLGGLFSGENREIACAIVYAVSVLAALLTFFFTASKKE